MFLKNKQDNLKPYNNVRFQMSFIMISLAEYNVIDGLPAVINLV